MRENRNYGSAVRVRFLAPMFVVEQGFDSPMLHHRTKCRTRMHWQPVRTSDKLKGQLMRLSFKFTRDYAHEFDILAETDTENFDRSLRDGLDLELYQPVYEMPFFDQ